MVRYSYAPYDAFFDTIETRGKKEIAFWIWQGALYESGVYNSLDGAIRAACDASSIRMSAYAICWLEKGEDGEWTAVYEEGVLIADGGIYRRRGQ